MLFYVFVKSMFLMKLSSKFPDDNKPYDLSTKSPARKEEWKELKPQLSPPPASTAPVIRPYPLSPHNVNIPYPTPYVNVWNPQPRPLYGLPYVAHSPVQLPISYHLGHVQQLHTENLNRRMMHPMMSTEVPMGYSAAYPMVNTDSRSGSPVNPPIPSPTSSAESDSSTSVGPSSKKQRKPKDLSKLECSCGKTYSTFSGLNKHKSGQCNTRNKKIFPCKDCQKIYVTLGALKMHIRTHTLPCKCKICGKAFSRPWLLQGHIRTHTGEKPFKCTHCDRAFADRSNLRAHLQTHSEVKKYRCKNCSKTFSRMSLLIKHDENNCPGVRR